MKVENILSELISYPSISETSNLDIINFISDYLKKLNIGSKKIMGNDGQFNLYSRIGPNLDGGIILSGHTDVVPVSGQNWSTNPFQLIKKKNKLFGRGTADMKGFIAVVLSLIPEIKKKKLKKPIHLVFSYDEEIGCIGIQKLIPFLKKIKPKPKYCIVGEPTEMRLINQHKGKKNYIATFSGIESHSSLVENGVNAINYCSEFVNFLKLIQKDLKKQFINKKFTPPYPTISIGKIFGGIAINIIPKKCTIEFEIRDNPDSDINSIEKKIYNYIKKLQNSMKKENNECFINIKKTNNFPALQTDPHEKIISLCLNSLESNSLDSVSFGTEAGVFDKLGFQTIVCGPGSIKQAHRPNEFIEINQLKSCNTFIKKLLEEVC